MATPRDLRRVALLALYQLDATNARTPEDHQHVRATLNDLPSLADEGLTFIDSDAAFRMADMQRAFLTALGAWNARDAADAEFKALAPEWPAARMPAVDRAILRLARFEIEQGENPPKAVVHEAVELAKAFSTDKSPAFVNGILGRVLKRFDAEHPADPPTTDSPAPDSPQPLPTPTTTSTEP